MSGFFTRLAERQLSETGGVSPRLPSRFAHSSMGMDIPTADGLTVQFGLEDVRKSGLQEPIQNDSGAAPDHTATHSIADRPSPASNVFNGTGKHDTAMGHQAVRPRDASHTKQIAQPKTVPSAIQQERQRRVPVWAHEASGTERVSGQDMTKTHRDSEPVRTTEERRPVDEQMREVIMPPTAIAPATEAPFRAPLVPSSRDGRTEALPSFAMPEHRPPRGTEEPSVVHVSIGRIEVRAVMEPPSVLQRPAPPKAKTMSLDEYLKKRQRGRR